MDMLDVLEYSQASFDWPRKFDEALVADNGQVPFALKSMSIAGLSKPTSFRSQGSGSQHPAVSNTSSDPAEAQFIVVATSSFLRLYPADSLQVFALPN